MSDSASNILEVSVTELSAKLKRTVEDTFGYVRVRGEISGYRGPHSSGHSYFSLKDDRARLEAVIWRGQAAKLKHLPEEGLEVIASGKLTTYPGSSKYQIVIDNIEPAGAGALMALLEERRKKLAAEGLFDDNRKQLLPYMPRVIGVVTSPTGAVIRDILHRIADRFPVHVLVWPVRVQGDSTGPEVANGIHRLNRLPEGGAIPRPELIIVARGGGSLEDLWGFNDEVVVRAAADSMIPLISAVGHETDWTLIDHAADWRAPTPTAAAERAVPVKAELESNLADLSARLRGAISRLADRRRNDLRSAARGIRNADTLLAMPRRQFDEAAGRLGRGLERGVELARGRLGTVSAKLSPRSLFLQTANMGEKFSALRRRRKTALYQAIDRKRQGFEALAPRIRTQPIIDRLTAQGRALDRARVSLDSRFVERTERSVVRLDRNARLLETLSYRNTLERGFAVVRNEFGHPVTKASEIAAGARFLLEMQDGELDAIASGKPVRSSAPRKAQKASKKPKLDQGDLF